MFDNNVKAMVYRYFLEVYKYGAQDFPDRFILEDFEIIKTDNCYGCQNYTIISLDSHT